MITSARLRSRPARSGQQGVRAHDEGTDAGWEPSATVVVASVSVATLLLLVRQPGHPVWDTVWAEDGGIFLGEAYAHPWWQTLVSDYRGYLHVVARLLALPAAAVPVPLAADVLALVSASAVAVLAAYVYWVSGAVLRGTWARALLAALVVVLPAAGYEVSVNLANLHWYLDFACALALVRRGRTRNALVADTTVVLLAVLSDPLTGLLLPLAAAVALRGDRSDRLLAGVFVVALATQLALGAAVARPEPYGPVVLADIPVFYGLRVAGSLLLGDAHLGEVLRMSGPAAAWIPLVVVVALVGYGIAAPGADRQRRLGVAAAAGLSVAFLAAPLLLRGTGGSIEAGTFTLNDSRYTLAPLLFLVLALLLLLDRDDAWLRGAGRREAQVLAGVWIAATVLTSWSVVSVRTAGPSWDAAVERARADCRQGRPGPVVTGRVADLLNATPAGYVRVPVAPGVDPPEWVAPVPCSRLR